MQVNYGVEKPSLCNAIPVSKIYLIYCLWKRTCLVLTLFVFLDLQFAVEWDEKYRNEAKIAKSYPKVILSSYPPGFNPGNGNTVRETPGARLCFCETKVEDPNPIVRINTGRGYSGDEPLPTQIPFIAAGFFFARAEFLVDVPFDPYIVSTKYYFVVFLRKQLIYNEFPSII